jgi:hypothetical protein
MHCCPSLNSPGSHSAHTVCCGLANFPWSHSLHFASPPIGWIFPLGHSAQELGQGGWLTLE